MGNQVSLSAPRTKSNSTLDSSSIAQTSKKDKDQWAKTIGFAIQFNFHSSAGIFSKLQENELVDTSNGHSLSELTQDATLVSIGINDIDLEHSKNELALFKKNIENKLKQIKQNLVFSSQDKQPINSMAQELLKPLVEYEKQHSTPTTNNEKRDYIINGLKRFLLMQEWMIAITFSDDLYPVARDWNGNKFLEIMTPCDYDDPFKGNDEFLEKVIAWNTKIMEDNTRYGYYFAASFFCSQPLAIQQFHIEGKLAQLGWGLSINRG